MNRRQFIKSAAALPMTMPTGAVPTPETDRGGLFSDLFYRVRLLKFSSTALSHLFYHLHSGARVKIDGVPKNAAFGDCNYDYSRCLYLVKVYSPAFSMISEGAVIPEISCVVTVLE